MVDEINDLIKQIILLSKGYSEDVIQKIAFSFLQISDKDFNLKSFQADLISSIPKADLRSVIVDLFEAWESSKSQIIPSSIGLSILTALNSKEFYSGKTLTELVWTGPNSQVIPLRRTDQTLLQVINSAKKELLIVSFAVYNIDFIVEALQNASLRDVKISIVLESEEESGGRLSVDGLRTVGIELKELVDFFVWPQENRPVSADGIKGVLHAKLALADSRLVFISSANLTSHAMELNMEMGVLIQGGEHPQRIKRHFGKLISEGVLTLFQS